MDRAAIFSAVIKRNALRNFGSQSNFQQSGFAVGSDQARLPPL
jgi:hypothetical protein